MKYLFLLSIVLALGSCSSADNESKKVASSRLRRGDAEVQGERRLFSFSSLYCKLNSGYGRGKPPFLARIEFSYVLPIYLSQIICILTAVVAEAAAAVVVVVAVRHHRVAALDTQAVDQVVADQVVTEDLTGILQVVVAMVTGYHKITTKKPEILMEAGMEEEMEQELVVRMGIHNRLSVFLILLPTLLVQPP